jgi:two-component system sensor histidine kinase/response regulator
MVAKGQRVLVVDDNVENRALAQATLEDEDYIVALATNGEEGIAAFERMHPDCVLLDIQMPGMNGIEACERIRALPGGDLVAIVFFTAQRDITTFDRALAAGGDDFLTKPVRPSELIVRIQTALRLRKIAGERSDLYAQVKRQRDDLQRLQLQKEQLTAFLVHDFKNPVNAIELQAERLLRDPNVSERARSVGLALRTESRALMRMILNLLDLSRSDEGRLAPARVDLDVAELVRSVFDEHRGGAGAASVELVAEVAAGTRLYADADLLQRVLSNLVENAIRHASDGTVRVIATRTTDALELRVADTGTGVPEDQRLHVFERFETGGGSRNRGLGLSFCQVAVQAHGGEIWIEDGKPGAVFCVRIPDGAP